MLMLDPVMALPAPSASPCTLLGVAGGASSAGTAGLLPLESSSLWHPLSGRDLPFLNPSGAPVTQSEDALPAVGTHPPFPDHGAGQLCNLSAFKALSESWAEDVLPDFRGQLCSPPQSPPWSDPTHRAGLCLLHPGLLAPTVLPSSCRLSPTL